MKEITTIGYVVKTTNGNFVGNDGSASWENAATPHSHSEAYRRVGLYIERFPASPIPAIEAVTQERELTPIECASKRFAGMLKDLLAQNGVDLGLTDAQMEHKFAKELVDLGASPVVDAINACRR